MLHFFIFTQYHWRITQVSSPRVTWRRWGSSPWQDKWPLPWLVQIHCCQFFYLCVCVCVCHPWIKHTGNESFVVFTSSRSTCTRSIAFMGMWALVASWLAETRRPSCGGWVQPIDRGHRQMHPKLWMTWSWRSGRHLKCWAEERSVRAAMCEYTGPMQE